MLTVSPGTRRGHAERPGRAGRSARPDGGLRGRADRDDLPAADLGRAGPGPVVGGGHRRGPPGAGPIGGIARGGRRRSGSTAPPAPSSPATPTGGPLRAALLWMDQRAFREADEISATGDPVLRYVSGRVSPEWMLPKALWLKRNEPEVYDRADRIVECTDWMMHRLTGDWTLSLNHVAVKWNYARPDGGWPLGLLRAVGLDDLPAKWPEPIVPLGRGEGDLVPGGGRGPRAVRRDAGGAGRDRRLSRHARHGGDRRGRRRGDRRLEHLPPGAVARSASSAPGRPVAIPTRPSRASTRSRPARPPPARSSTGIAATSPAREQAEADRRGVNVYEVLDEQAAAVPPGADGLVVRDDWQGNRSPYKNPQARGAIAGLSLAHGPGHIFRALYEATACGTRHILEDASAHGLRVERVFLGGGGAKSPLWLQIHADILKRPIHLTRETRGPAPSARRWPPPSAAGIYRRLRRGRPRHGRDRTPRRARSRPTPRSTTSSSTATSRPTNR